MLVEFLATQLSPHQQLLIGMSHKLLDLITQQYIGRTLLQNHKLLLSQLQETQDSTKSTQLLLMIVVKKLETLVKFLRSGQDFLRPWMQNSSIHQFTTRTILLIIRHMFLLDMHLWVVQLDSPTAIPHSPPLLLHGVKMHKELYSLVLVDRPTHCKVVRITTVLTPHLPIA